MAPVPTPTQITRSNSRSTTSRDHWCCSNQKRVAGDQQDCRGASVCILRAPVFTHIFFKLSSSARHEFERSILEIA
jgi:hypothetical protein